MKIKKYKNDIISIAVTLLFTMAIIIGCKILYKDNIKDNVNKGTEYYEAIVTDIKKENLKNDEYIENIELGYQDITLKFLEGPYKDKEYEVKNNVSRVYNFKVHKGSKVVACMYFTDNKLNGISVYSYKRTTPLLILVILFLVVVIGIGGIKGIKTIMTVIFTIVCILFFMLPLIIRGVSPILASIIIVILSITMTFILVSGINKKSLSAIIGSFIAVTIAGIIAYGFGKWAHLSGVTMENAESIMYISETSGLKINGLLFAAILISSLGAIMDTTMSIASSIFEIVQVNKEIEKKELFNRGMNIGRDIMGTMTNTLILAFVGGAINLMIMLYVANMWTIQLMNLDIIGTEIIQGLSGTIAMILAIPITAMVSIYFCKIQH